MFNSLLIKLGTLFLKKHFKLFFLLICFIPIFFSALYIFSQFQKINKNQKTIEYAFSHLKKNYRKRIQQKAFIEKYSKSDPNFIHKNLEALHFMHDEKIKLEKLYNNDSFRGATLVKNRLNFLKNENKFSLKEEVRYSTTALKETNLKLNSPIEINEDDLKKLLSAVEEVTISKFIPLDNAPQMIIQNFELKKTNSSFIINNLSILKRDFIK
jgi:hypothetical protein